jgi:pimeloyl-ACP methyl ester carboxylesterase
MGRPTWVIHGSKHPLVPFKATGKRVHEMMAGLDLKVYENGPPGFAATHPDQLNKALLAFLQKYTSKNYS